jgi:hypothetical protein
LNPFMRAHGYLPGPTQRPVTAGLMTGMVALPPLLLLTSYCGALATIAEGVGLSRLVVASLVTALGVVAGGVYGWVFMRAANDRRGGWLFGIAFGFLLWMLVPALLYWFWQAPLVTGRASQVMFAAHLVYGFILGVAFPHVHKAIQPRSPWAE